MIKTEEQYEIIKAHLEDNKNGNQYCKPGYLSDDVVAFVILEVQAWESKQTLLDLYYN